MNEITVGGRSVGHGWRPLLIAEVGQAHDGSLGMAHAYIDAAADAGADAVKFQTHIAAEESSLEEPFRVKFSRQDETRFAYWKRMEFSAEQWAGLAQHAKERGVIFLSSAFSLAAVRLLAALDMTAWKVGSGEFRSQELLDEMMATRRPILYSTGMSTWEEIDAAVARLRLAEHPFMLFQCTSQYPTPPTAVGLNVIDELRARHGCPVGLSDHTGDLFAPLAAMARGADAVEVHITFDKRMFGPDIAASVTISDLALLARGRDSIHEMLSHPVDKTRMAADLAAVRGLFTKSVAPARALRAGEILTEDLLVPRKPGTGIPYSQRTELVGKRVVVDVPRDRLLRWEHLQESDA